MFKNWIYPAYARIAKPRRARKRKGTDRGRFIQSGAIITAFLGLNTDASFIYQIFAFLFFLTIAARIGLLMHKPNVSLMRKLPRYATVGEPFEYPISVRNTGKQLESDLKVIDHPVVIPPSRNQFLAQKEPGEESRNAYDRFIGFHRFMHLQRLNTGITCEQAEIPDLSLHGTIDVIIKAEPLRRGLVKFSSTTILHPDPLNLNQGILKIDNNDSLLVLPKRYKIPRSFSLNSGRHFQPGGINSAWSIGESDEFVSLRDYRDGDSVRKIHWASSAKRNKPVVKEFQDEYFVRQALVLDTSSKDSEVFEEAISLAASFALALNKPDSVLDLVYQENILTSGRGTDSISHQLEALATMTRSDLHLDLLCQTALSHSRYISACIVVLTDWTEAHQNFLAGLKAANIPMRVFIVTRDPSKFNSTEKDTHIMPIGEIQEHLLSL
jgi:uncharacterized protein (DUF58 family)